MPEEYIHVPMPAAEQVMCERNIGQAFGVFAFYFSRENGLFSCTGPWPEKVAKDIVGALFPGQDAHQIVDDLRGAIEKNSVDRNYPTDVVRNVWDLSVGLSQCNITSNPTWVGTVHASATYRGEGYTMSEEEKKQVRASDARSYNSGAHDLLMACIFGPTYFADLDRDFPDLLDTPDGVYKDKDPEIDVQEAGRRILFGFWDKSPTFLRDGSNGPVMPQKFLEQLVREG